MSQSAVTRNYVKAHELAASRLDQEALLLLQSVEQCRLSARHAGSVFSSAQDTASSYLIDDLRKAAVTLKRSAEAHRQKIGALLRAPCPACMAGQRKHCPECGSCPGRDRGPSCRDLSCETMSLQESILS